MCIEPWPLLRSRENRAEQSELSVASRQELPEGVLEARYTYTPIHSAYTRARW